MSTIQSICICGAGTMGSCIAQVAAQSGYHTILYDVNTHMLAKGKDGIEKRKRNQEGKQEKKEKGKWEGIK